MQSCPQCFRTCEDAHRFCHSCGTVLQAPRVFSDPLLGALLPGGYLIRELLAEGGMGRIYRAEQRALDRAVAVKVIHPHLAGDPEIAARFLVEARAASRLNHPNAVTVFAFGNMPSGQPYLVMQLLHGKQLRRVDEEEGPLSLERIIDLVSQVLAALEQAHSLSIVHQDVKPDNIIIERLRSGGDLVKVIDFGLAHLLAETSELLSSPVLAGTPSYMSPEHARGERVDGRSDLYSVGVILYELLTGSLPFRAATTTETLLAMLNDAPTDPRERAPKRMIPDLLAEATMRALAKKPGERFQTADELAVALTESSPARRASQHSIPPLESGTGPLCLVCGARNELRRAFCGECGAAVAKPKEALSRE
jgi:serine/threonine protein kinase